MQNYLQIQWYVDILMRNFPRIQFKKPRLIMGKQSQNQLMFAIIMALCLRSIAFIKSTDSQNYAKICQSCTINLPQLWMQIAELWVQNDIAMAGCQNWVCRCRLQKQYPPCALPVGQKPSAPMVRASIELLFSPGFGHIAKMQHNSVLCSKCGDQ